MSITTILMYNHNYKYTTVADCVTIYISMTMFTTCKGYADRHYHCESNSMSMTIAV